MKRHCAEIGIEVSVSVQETVLHLCTRTSSTCYRNRRLRIFLFDL
nr:MAG TPA: hypothetical protein [Caudoviricetes sp.]